jgi:hypothetical protein
VQTSWGPADLDVAHCSTDLALLHGPAWGLRFAEAYEEAGGVLAATAGERLYWRLLDALAFAAGAQWVARPWREAGRAELTTPAVEERLDAYVTARRDGLNQDGPGRGHGDEHRARLPRPAAEPLAHPHRGTPTYALAPSRRPCDASEANGDITHRDRSA